MTKYQARSFDNQAPQRRVSIVNVKVDQDLSGMDDRVSLSPLGFEDALTALVGTGKKD